jgi:hypothetical protein
MDTDLAQTAPVRTAGETNRVDTVSAVVDVSFGTLLKLAAWPTRCRDARPFDVRP